MAEESNVRNGAGGLAEVDIVPGTDVMLDEGDVHLKHGKGNDTV
jgi:hypothetical protein